MADTIAVMNEGRIEQAGTAADLYERPVTAFVANFLGVSNLIEGRLRSSDGPTATCETHDGAVLHVPSERVPADVRASGEALRIGVRPEKVMLVPGGEPCPPDVNALRGTVVVASFLGVSIQYVIRAAGGEELTVFAQNTDGSEPDSFGVGREVQLTFRPAHTFVVGA